MSPRPSHSRPSSSPYSRRNGSHPKSSRQQFSACGACRMRRVRCDLKDLPHSSEPRPCSNCRERGLNCVDEYADMKAVKLLRRGRRLQQVEAVYGKTKSAADNSLLASRVSSQIPVLSPDFFSSPFWTWFCVQRPILDPIEFRQRYAAHIEGTQPLGHEGGILAMLLVLWAATFGVDEFGSLIKDDRDDTAASPTSRAGHSLQKANSVIKQGETSFKHVGKRDREKTSSMLAEILELIDFHGVMRRPTFDGVRILLLTLPLMEEVPHLERMAMYEATLSQARALCAPIPKHTLPSALPPFSAEESVLRSRIYLYAHTLEGISTAIKGGYLLYHNDDVDTLRRMVYLSPERTNTSFAHHVTQNAPGDGINGGGTSTRDAQLSHLSAMAFRLSNVCRKVHDVLTGSKAARRVEEHNLIDVTGMRGIWQELDQCWHGFSAMKNSSATDSSKVSIDCLVDTWLIFIFECHNIILEHLKHFTSAEDSPVFSHAASPSSSSPYLSPHEFYLEAKARCVQLLPNVLRLVRRHLMTRDESLNLFAWDTGLVRDGCFFAALLSIGLQEDSRCVDGHGIKVEESDDFITPEEGVRLCLSALTEMRWVFSKSDERIETIRAAVKNMNEKRANLLSKSPSQSAPSTAHQRLGPSMDNTFCLPYSESFAHSLDAQDAREGRRSLSVNIMRPTRRRADSAPDIACNAANARINDWPTYTPPTSASTAYNSSSPVTRAMASPASYKSGHDDSVFCYVPEALDHFAYPGFIPPSSIPATQALYHHRNAFLDTRDVQDVSDGLSPCAFTSTESSLQLTSDIDCYVNDFYA